MSEESLLAYLLGFYSRNAPERIAAWFIAGHPLKITIDPVTESFEDRLFARDTGIGVAQRLVDAALAAKNLK